MTTRKLLWFLLPVLLASCTTLQEGNAMATEKKLVKAGFHVLEADTPQKSAILNGMTPYKLETGAYQGKEVYRYADPAKNLVYVGGSNEFLAYQALVAHSNAKKAAAMNDLMIHRGAFAGPVAW